MRRSRHRIAVVLASVLCFSFVALTHSPVATASDDQGGQGNAPPAADGTATGKAVHHDRSAALRDIPPAAPQTTPSDEPTNRDTFMPQHPVSATADPVVQRSASPSVPSPATNFLGVGAGFSGPNGTFSVNAAPPDTNSAVGPNQIVEVVNTSFAVFSKTGTVLYGPVQNNTLWSGFGGQCQTSNDGDPVVRYDSLADRWIITQLAVTSTPYLECFAVSQTGDPTGAWNRYSFSFGTNFPDYPKIGVWPDAYYATYNIFANGNTFTGAEACAMDRTKMLQGLPAAQKCFMTSNSFGGLLPSDLDGATPPPAGEPNTMVALGTTSTTLAYWAFHADFANPANATFTGPGTVTVASYSAACGGGTCIPQSGTNQQLDSLADRLMFRLAYRNFGDHESLVVSHSVTAGSAVGVRWYELRLSGGTPTVFQQSTYAPADGGYRWMGSAAMDHNGDIGIGFSLSSSSLHPAIHYTGRLASDPLNQMTQGEGSIIDGPGSQSGNNLSRWGDYSSMSIDPADDCTLWYSNEYLPTTGSFNWATRVASFKLPGCGTPPGDDFSIAANPSSASVNAGSTTTVNITTAVTSGSAQNVALSASGLPAGVTASFNPTSVTAGGPSTLTLTASSSAASSNSTVTITGTGTSATHTTTVALTVVGSTPPAITNGGFELGNLSGWTPSGTESVTTLTPHSGTYDDQGGSTSPTNGDSSVRQTFTAPAGSTKVSFWYRMSCPDTVRYDWVTATLRDNTTGKTTTILPKTCSTNSSYVQVTANLVAGHNFTLTLTNHDDNYPTDPSYTRFDDITVS